MNKSIKKLCVLVASALSVANVNNSQAMNYLNQDQFVSIENLPITESREIENVDYNEIGGNQEFRSNNFFSYKKIDDSYFEKMSQQTEEILENTPLSKTIILSDSGKQSREESEDSYQNPFFSYKKIDDSYFEKMNQQTREILKNTPLSKTIILSDSGKQSREESEDSYQNPFQDVPEEYSTTITSNQGGEEKIQILDFSRYSDDDSDSGDDHVSNYVEPGQPKQYIIPNDKLLSILKVILEAPSYCSSVVLGPFVRRWEFSLHNILSPQTPYLRYILSNVDFYVLTLGDEIVGAIGLKRIDCASGPTVRNAFVLLDPKKINRITSSLEPSCQGIEDVIRKEIVRLSELVRYCTYYYHIDGKGEIEEVDLDVLPLEQFDPNKVEYCKKIV